MTGQKEFLEKELNEMEARNSSEKEYKVIVLRIFNSMKKDRETIKNNQPEMNNDIFEIKNTLERINSRLE